MGWVELIYFIVALILSVALAPKPPDAKAAAFDDFDFPIAEEGREIPVIFGEVELKGANTLWYGSLGWVKIKKRSGFSKTTIGYKYYLAFHLGLCHGPVDEVTKVTVGDKHFWSGSIGPGNGSGGGDFPDLFGGDKQEGGVVGSFDIMMGAADQAVNENLTRQLFAGVWRDRIPPPHTAYRGILGFYWRRGYIGTTKYPKPWAITARRHSANWQDGTVWYPTKLRINSKAFNGAHIIYECMTNKEWGRGLPILRMNAASFEAAADQLYDEDFGLRLNWNQGLTIEGFIQVILDHIAGVLVWRTSTSQFELHLIRNNYVLADLPSLNESNVVSVEDYQRNAWGETVNELQLKYVDPDSAKDVAITVHDLANIQIQGGTNTDTVDLPGIRDHELAKRVAIRELNARSNPLAKVILIANRTVHDFYQGQVVKFSWEKYGIVDMPIRILKMNKGTLDKGRIRIEAVQDIFSLDTITYLVVPPAEDPPDDPAPPADDDDNEASVISTTTTAPPSNPADGDRYYVQPGTGTGAWAGLSGLVEWDEEANVSEEGEFTGGWVEVTLPPGTPFYDEENDQLVTVNTGGESEPLVIGITVANADTSDVFEDITRVEFANSSIEDQGGGTVLVTPSGGGGGGGSALLYFDQSLPSSNTVTNSTAEFAFGSSYQVPLSYLQPGVLLRGKCFGVWSTAASAGTLRIRVKLGSTTILDTTAITATNSVAARAWWLDFQVGIVTGGSGGQVEAQGLLQLGTAVSTVVGVPLGNADRVAVDIASARALTITVQWGTASASNTINLRQMTVHGESVDVIQLIEPVSLLHFEGLDTSTNIIDSGRIQWVAQGNAQIDTAQFRFGGSSLLLDGTGDFVESMSDEAFVFGTTDFTIECFARYSALGGNNFAFTFGGGWGVYAWSGQWAVYNNAGSNIIIGGTSAINTWYHVALVRSGTTMTLYINGAAVGSATVSTNFTASKIRIGAQPGGIGYMAGWIDEFRVHGSAIYSASFTAPTTSFADPIAPASPEVSILHFDDVDASTVFTDVLGKVWTAGGTAQIDTAQSKFGGSSLLDPTPQSHIITPLHADFGFGTENFTVEFWYRPSVLGIDLILWDTRTSVSQTRPMLRTFSGGDLRFVVGNTDRITSAAGVLVVGTWAHIALCRFNGNTKLFVNGTQVGSTYVDTNNYEAGPVTIGVAGDALGSNLGGSGWYDEHRICKGYARYTENFLVPTAAFPDPGGFPTLYSDEFNGSVISGDWSQLNISGRVTAVVSGGSAQLTLAGLNDGSPRFYWQATAPSFTVPRRYRLRVGTITTPNFAMAGLAIRNSSGSGNYYLFGKHQGQLGVLRFNTNYVGTDKITSTGVPVDNCWLEIVDDGTTLYFNYSLTGAPGSFVNFWTALRSAFIVTPDQIMFGFFDGQTTSSMEVLTYETREGAL